MEIQDNVSKANEIARAMLPYNNAEYHACYNSAIKAMQWKDEEHAKEKQQWIEKACEWLFKNTRFTTNDIRDFKNAMEEL